MKPFLTSDGGVQSRPAGCSSMEDAFSGHMPADHAMRSTEGRWSTGVAVVTPCYKVTRHVQAVIAQIGPDVDRIYCVDDACPDNSGDFIAANVSDLRVLVLHNGENQGGRRDDGRLPAGRAGRRIRHRQDRRRWTDGPSPNRRVCSSHSFAARRITPRATGSSI